MPNIVKEKIVDDLTLKFQNSSGIYFANYSGIDVQNVKMLDKKLWELEKGIKLEINKPPKLFDVENIAINLVIPCFRFI